MFQVTIKCRYCGNDQKLPPAIFFAIQLQQATCIKCGGTNVEMEIVSFQPMEVKIDKYKTQPLEEGK